MNSHIVLIKPLLNRRVRARIGLTFAIDLVKSLSTFFFLVHHCHISRIGCMHEINKEVDDLSDWLKSENICIKIQVYLQIEMNGKYAIHSNNKKV